MAGWQALGNLFCPDRNHSWMQTHASTPFPVHLEGDRYRVYFSTRDAGNQSSIAALEMELLPRPRLLKLTGTPVLSPGEIGLFDDSGVTMSQCIRHDGRDYLYYQGWNLATKVPFRCAVGLAKSNGKEFRKYGEAPVLDRGFVDPYSLSYPWIRIEGTLWRMWYGSTLCWERDGLDVQHVVKYAESDDGINWRRNNNICIPLSSGESGIVRPSVEKTDLYRMWYSVRLGRKETYRLGYAVSEDGLVWERQDHLAHAPAASDWDSDMQCYPCLFSHKGQRYMLYNGNGFGRTGFGLAVWHP